MRFIGIILVSLAAFAQSPLAFEVASVKSQPFNGQGFVGIVVRGDTLDAQHVSLNDLVSFAFNLRAVQLSGGPTWADRSQAMLVAAELYQVTAKAVGNPPPPMEVFRQMLQTLLADRFQLKVHHVQKNLPTYNLVVGKGGLKLKESSTDTKFSLVTSSTGNWGLRMVAKKMTISQLVEQISFYAARPVFDKTGLTARYDFTLEFVPETVATLPDAAADGPTLSTGIQDLGLKLEPATAPFDTVVIDHAEKPSAN